LAFKHQYQQYWYIVSQQKVFGAGQDISIKTYALNTLAVIAGFFYGILVNDGLVTVGPMSLQIQSD